MSITGSLSKAYNYGKNLPSRIPTAGRYGLYAGSALGAGAGASYGAGLGTDDESTARKLGRQLAYGVAGGVAGGAAGAGLGWGGDKLHYALSGKWMKPKVEDTSMLNKLRRKLIGTKDLDYLEPTHRLRHYRSVSRPRLGPQVALDARDYMSTQLGRGREFVSKHLPAARNIATVGGLTGAGVGAGYLAGGAAKRYADSDAETIRARLAAAANL